MDIIKPENTLQFLSGGGEMGKLIRSIDWSTTALGPVESWPQSLRTSVSLCLSSTFPILIAWGPETIQIYNDSYRPICGAKHPESMGQNFRICWETALPVVGDHFTRGQQGEGTYIKDQRMYLDRYGYLEEAFMTFSFAPIRDETGEVGGIFHPITETTENMLSARRTKTLRDLGAVIVKAKSVQEIGVIMADKYPDYNLDIPFILFYQLDKTGKIATLKHHTGLINAPDLATPIINIEEDKTTWPLQHVVTAQQTTIVNKLQQLFGSFDCEPYTDTPNTAVIVPLRIAGKQNLFGFIVAGVSSRRMLDEHYLNFYELLGNTFNTAISTIYAYEQEQKRAEALAEIDRSKTSFFSNVSHEFRTPLTLMLGPLEELTGHPAMQQPSVKNAVESIHQNSLRLLKLVNNLLDYSRVEAGRVAAAYQPLNLSELTTDLASSFRSIIEKAGMQLIVACEVIKEPVYADRQMWEKIVLNLLSNAFKYTLQGSITVSLKQENNAVLLQVRDTGIGIPAKELPLMFQRFHRVENGGGRTLLGSGIGLSLVNELVNLHKGTITVESLEGEGSIFTVQLAVGKKHLPPQQVVDNSTSVEVPSLKDSFIKEVQDMLQQSNQNNAAVFAEITDIGMPEIIPINKTVKILIVDDNNDMRAYLGRLLEPYYILHFAINGSDAIRQVNTVVPDLILSDLMMPLMDGKSMLKILKEDLLTAKIPVIFLSARAGEEARMDGLEAGADDYLVKPFSAVELLIKIKAQLKISKARTHSELKLRNLLKKAPVGIALYHGPEFIIEMVNERMLGYWDKTLGQVVHKKLFDVVPELLGQGFENIMKNVYETGTNFISKEIGVNLLKDGEPYILFVTFTIEAIRDQENMINGLMTVASDITEQVLAKKELKKVTDTLNLALDGAGIGTWSADLMTNEITMSDRGRAMHGIKEGIVISIEESTLLISEEYRERISNAIENAISNGQSFDEVFSIYPRDGSKKKWIRSAGKAYYDEEGMAINVAGTLMDITEQREDELRKNDFIGMVSHELKTPLTSLNGYAQILNYKAKERDDIFTAEMLNKILMQVKKMSSIINGFLNVSRLESGKIHLSKKVFDMNKLIEEIIEETLPMAANHSIEFMAGNPAILTADRDKIGSVLTNLLSNAIKYTANEKNIRVTCCIVSNTVLVCVIDEGIGIRAHDAEKLFQRYYRVESIESQHISGFGIGLYLSAEIIQHHEGKIGVISKAGKGSNFHFELPVNEQITSSIAAAV